MKISDKEIIHCINTNPECSSWVCSWTSRWHHRLSLQHWASLDAGLLPPLPRVWRCAQIQGLSPNPVMSAKSLPCVTASESQDSLCHPSITSQHTHLSFPCDFLMWRGWSPTRQEEREKKGEKQGGRENGTVFKQQQTISFFVESLYSIILQLGFMISLLLAKNKLEPCIVLKKIYSHKASSNPFHLLFCLLLTIWK